MHIGYVCLTSTDLPGDLTLIADYLNQTRDIQFGLRRVGDFDGSTCNIANVDEYMNFPGNVNHATFVTATCNLQGPYLFRLAHFTTSPRR